jgi:hypothetical protein
VKLQATKVAGFELGADVTANLNLDDFLVFGSDENRSIKFFKKSEHADASVQSADQLIQAAFTQQNVFTEFVRAVEGVPRDALNLAASAATKAYGRRISMNDVVEAARDWYQRDKASAIKSDDVLSDILSLIISEVIGQRRARAFLFPSKIRNKYIDELFNARVLHLLKKNVSSNDRPGERFDVFKIDYGCYVDLKNTNREPLGLFETEDGYVEVPRDDYRSIRRAILQPEMFRKLSGVRHSLFTRPRPLAPGGCSFLRRITVRRHLVGDNNGFPPQVIRPSRRPPTPPLACPHKPRTRLQYSDTNGNQRLACSGLLNVQEFYKSLRRPIRSQS